MLSTIQAEPFVVHTLKMLGDLVENILNEVTQTKKVPSTWKEIQSLLNISKRNTEPLEYFEENAEN